MKRQGKAKVQGLVVRASSLKDAQEEWTPGTPGPRCCHCSPGECVPAPLPTEGYLPTLPQSLSPPFLTLAGSAPPPEKPDPRHQVNPGLRPAPEVRCMAYWSGPSSFLASHPGFGEHLLLWHFQQGRENNQTGFSGLCINWVRPHSASIVQMRTLRIREAKRSNQGHKDEQPGQTEMPVQKCQSRGVQLDCGPAPYSQIQGLWEFDLSHL